MKNDNTWMKKYNGLSDSNMYLTSFYFTITTITTVGYGDISGGTPSEKVYCILMMVIGVISFSFATGSLASIIQNYDSQNEAFDEKLNILDTLNHDHNLPLDLYIKIRQFLKLNVIEDINNKNNFVQELPAKLRKQLAKHLYEKTS